MELKKRLDKLLFVHTKKSKVSCDETCMCWEIEALLCDLDVQAQKSAQADVLTVCEICGGWLKGGECENCNSPIAADNT